MSTTLEQTAEAIAEERCQAGKQQFETYYAELLPALKGSQMTYEPRINHWGSLELAFSKPGIPTLALPLLADGKVRRNTEETGLDAECLTTLLADYIVSKEADAIEKAFKSKRLMKYRKHAKILLIFFALDVLAGFLVILVGPPSNSVSGVAHYSLTLSVIGWVMWLIVGLLVLLAISAKLENVLPE